MSSTDDPRKPANLLRVNGEKKHSKHASWHVRIRTEWNPFRLARKAERLQDLITGRQPQGRRGRHKKELSPLTRGTGGD